MVSWEYGLEHDAQHCIVRASAYLASYMADRGLGGCTEMLGVDDPLDELGQAIRSLSAAVRLNPEKAEYSELLSILCALHLNQRSSQNPSVTRARR